MKKRILSVISALALCVSGTATAFAAEKGDVNGDGKVTAADALALLKKISAGSTDPASDDINGDGKVTAADALALLKSITGSSKPSLKDADKTLSILTWGDNTDLIKQVGLFCAKTGFSENNINIVRFGDTAVDLIKGLDEYLSSGGDADIIITNADYVHPYIDSSLYFMPLSELGLTKKDFPDAYVCTLDYGTDMDGVFKAISYDCEAGAYIYRKDLAEKYLGVSEPSDVQKLIGNWDSFTETAKLLSKENVSICPSVSSLWQVYKCGKSEPWITDFKLNMNEADKFYDMALEYQKNGYCQMADMWNYDWFDSLSTGRSLGEFMPAWMICPDTEANSVINNMTKEGEYAVCAGPKPFIWSGIYCGALAKCNTKLSAKKFIETICGDKDVMSQITNPATFSMPNNKSSVKDIIASGDAKIEQLGGQDYYKILDANAKKVRLNKNVSFFDYICDDVYTASIADLFSGNFKDKQAAADWFKEILKEITEDSIKTD